MTAIVRTHVGGVSISATTQCYYILYIVLFIFISFFLYHFLGKHIELLAQRYFLQGFGVCCLFPFVA